MRHASALASLVAVALAGPAMIRMAGSADTAVHERKEVAGLAVVFGAEPEPALTEEMQFLRWRITSVSDSAAYTGLQDATVTITRAGQQFGPFTVRPVRREPGLYQTQHIFTATGEYQSLLKFRKGDDPTVHSVDFNFRIADRATLEIPRRRPAGP